MIAKVVHDDLNAGGGGERLAISMIQVLEELGFTVDVETCTPLATENLEILFGNLDLHIRKVKSLDIYSILQNRNARTVIDNDEYDVVINTHGDLLPYSYQSANKKNQGQVHDKDCPNNKGTLAITYCHYPLVPYLVRNQKYNRYLCEIIKTSRSEIRSLLYNDDTLLSKAYLLYDKMMRDTIVVTNSEFSRKAINELYGNKAPTFVLSPPVDIKAFRSVLLYPKQGQRMNIILVLSRFSPDKKIENAISLARILSLRKVVDYRMIIGGSTCSSHNEYLLSLKNMIQDYGLEKYVRLKANISFEELIDLMSRSKVYFHPLAGEPFGISVAESMAAGLIPVVPHIGGNSEFVPRMYHYQTLDAAASIIEDALQPHSVSAEMDNHLRIMLSNLILQFSREKFKAGLQKLLNTFMNKPEQVPLLNTEEYKSHSHR